MHGRISPIPKNSFNPSICKSCLLFKWSPLPLPSNPKVFFFLGNNRNTNNNLLSYDKKINRQKFLPRYTYRQPNLFAVELTRFIFL